METTPERFFTRPEAAAHVRERGVPCSAGTLAKLASIGGGPAYRTFGRRALYTARDLDTWVAGKLSAVRLSTTEAAA